MSPLPSPSIDGLKTLGISLPSPNPKARPVWSALACQYFRDRFRNPVLADTSPANILDLCGISSTPDQIDTRPARPDSGFGLMPNPLAPPGLMTGLRPGRERGRGHVPLWPRPRFEQGAQAAQLPGRQTQLRAGQMRPETFQRGKGRSPAQSVSPGISAARSRPCRRDARGRRPIFRRLVAIQSGRLFG